MRAELSDGFEELDGCLLHRGHGYEPGDLCPFDEAGSNEDETAFECLHGKMHMDKLLRIPGRSDFGEMLRLGVSYAFALKDALSDSTLAGPLRIIVGADPEPPHPSVTVRYHRVRPGQPWLGEDFDGYRDAVMAIDF